MNAGHVHWSERGAGRSDANGPPPGGGATVTIEGAGRGVSERALALGDILDLLGEAGEECPPPSYRGFSPVLL